MIHGGRDREDIRPANDTGYRRDMYGTHNRSSQSLNVFNPARGYHYYWERIGDHTARGRLAVRQDEGWEIAPPEDQVRQGQELDPRFGEALSSVRERHDVVLLRIPEQHYRTNVVAPRVERAKYAANQATEEWTAQGTPIEQTPYGERAGGAIYYATPIHKAYQPE